MGWDPLTKSLRGRFASLCTGKSATWQHRT